MRSDYQQILLIIAGIVVSALLGVFFYREIFPEYKIYQEDYLALEEFRSSYTHQSIPPFKVEVKQIVIEDERNGPPVIDRCTSCHVALEIPYFSPTKIAKDLNGNVVLDSEGHPLKIPNEEYIWKKLDEKIAELRDDKVITQLRENNESAEVSRRQALADKYTALKTAQVGDSVYDVTKVLMMHPLMGNETRPFEFHPVEEYGCTSCHNGNGRGLVTDKAHGPVFDDQYDIEYLGPEPHFTEIDQANDPRFSKVFNHKPGHELLFQTTPLFVGALIQAKCMECHQTAGSELLQAASTASDLSQQRQAQVEKLTTAYQQEKEAVLNLLALLDSIRRLGLQKAMEALQEKSLVYILPAQELEHIAAQLQYLTKAKKGQPFGNAAQNNVLNSIENDLTALIGSSSLVEILEGLYKQQGLSALESFLKQYQGDPQARGSLFVKGERLDLNQDLLAHAMEAEKSLTVTTGDQKVISALSSDVDELTRNYQRGKELFLSQACYACHRISGLARGGVGPELTRIGQSYPWYIKESVVWPQADLKTSTMPNMRMDHHELEDLMAFLLAQKGGNRATSQTAYKTALQGWEAGKKMPWEKPISPAQIYDLRHSMTIFATEGCASCHRLQGFDSNVGFAVEKQEHSFDQLYQEQTWFRKLFPEVIHYVDYDQELPGSEIVAKIEQHADEIDRRIASDVRKNGILEEIDSKFSEAIEALYSPFRYASRAKNNYYTTLISQENDPLKIAQLKEEHQAWKDRVHRLLMVYIQTYGLGRLIGPHLNWTGIYRSDEWLMEHFHNPSGHVPRSIMPAFPFDDSKFYALTYMLDQLSVRNRNAIRQIWDHQGFDAKQAYEMLCAQCHGIDMFGNGAIAEWLYPIPKNLRNAEFLRNLTKDRVVFSIIHGVKGTPMPPWGEFAEGKISEIKAISHGTPVLKEEEVHFLVDWLYSDLPGGEVIKGAEVLKWKYTPEDVIEELEREGSQLKPLPEKSRPKKAGAEPDLSVLLSADNQYYASLHPIIYPQKPVDEKVDEKISDIFDVLPNPTDTHEKSYYIKKRYYTPQNIEAGKAFFLVNCAICHGNEGEGSGKRSEVMAGAKPRMLTNLDWVQSRDDLRLLRSIKYGVPGTAMTPWGDFTGSLQRLQLVIFIRSLSEEHERREKLSQALYQAYDVPLVIIESARVERSIELQKLKAELRQSQAKEESLVNSAMSSDQSRQEFLQVHEQKLSLMKEIQQLEGDDEEYLLLKKEIRKEREIYFNLGAALINKQVESQLLDDFIEMIKLNDQRYAIEKQQLIFHQTDAVDGKIVAVRQQIVQVLDQQMAELRSARQILEGKIATERRREELANNQIEIDSLIKLKAKLLTETQEALRLVQEQKEIVAKIKSGSR